MQVAPSCGHICNKWKWRHLVAKFGTNPNGATWWPNLQLMQVAPLNSSYELNTLVSSLSSKKYGRLSTSFVKKNTEHQYKIDALAQSTHSDYNDLTIGISIFDV